MTPFQYLRHYLKPRWGRLTPSSLTFLADHLDPPGYFAIGPFLVLMDLPESLQLQDRAPSLEEINAAFREAVAEARRQN